MKKIKIFTQNLCWMKLFKKNQRINEIREYIYYKKFDFVFLQEAVFNSDVKKLAQNNFTAYVKGRLGPRGGLAIISKKKFDKIEFYKFKSQGAIFSRQSTDRIIEKGFLAGYSGNWVYIDTHLICTYNQEMGKRIKILKRQFEQLWSFVKSKIKEGKKIVLAGDFNFNPNSNNYKEIIKLLNENTIKKRPKIKFKYKYGQRDFIFSSAKKSINYEEANYPIFVSDHPGIGVEILS